MNLSLARSSYSITRAFLARGVASASSLQLAREGGRTTVQLMGLPATALPADIRRMAERQGIKGGFEVQLEYRRYHPVGRASIHFDSAEGAREACAKLNGAEISTHRVTAFTRLPDPGDRWSQGFGPDGGNKERGKTVVLQGLSPHTSLAKLTDALRGDRYQLSEVSGRRPVESVSAGGVPAKGSDSPEKWWLVHLASVSEAHRLVRLYHMTVMDGSHLVQAHIMY